MQQTAAYSWLQPHRLHHQDINIRLTHIDAYSFPLLLKSVLGAIQCMIDLRYRDVHNILSSMMLKHVANLSIGESIIEYRFLKDDKRVPIDKVFFTNIHPIRICN